MGQPNQRGRSRSRRAAGYASPAGENSGRCADLASSYQRGNGNTLGAMERTRCPVSAPVGGGGCELTADLFRSVERLHTPPAHAGGVSRAAASRIVRTDTGLLLSTSEVKPERELNRPRTSVLIQRTCRTEALIQHQRRLSEESIDERGIDITERWMT
jgi:hypothetical protein